MNIKKAGLIALVMVVLALATGVVAAQDATPPGGPGERGDRGGRNRFEIGRALIGIVAEETGLSNREVLELLRSGATLAEIITENGGDVSAVVQQAVELATERINAAVDEGRMTQARADELLAGLEEAITTALNTQHPAQPGPGRSPRENLGYGLVVLAAEQTGLEPREIRAQLREGATLAEILSENNVDVDAFVETAAAQIEERVAAAVEAGRITQEQADRRLENLRERLTDLVNGVRSESAVGANDA